MRPEAIVLEALLEIGLDAIGIHAGSWTFSAITAPSRMKCLALRVRMTSTSALIAAWAIVDE